MHVLLDLRNDDGDDSSGSDTTCDVASRITLVSVFIF